MSSDVAKKEDLASLREGFSKKVDEALESLLKAINGNKDVADSSLAALEKCIDALEERNGLEGRENEDEVDEEEEPKTKAEDEQKMIPFDGNDKYNTLRDPFVRNKNELIEFAACAIVIYEQGEKSMILEQFEYDFHHWNEEHFKLLDKKQVQQLRDLVKEGGGQIKTGTGHRMSYQLSRVT